jgi:methyltransferase family protein
MTIRRVISFLVAAAFALVAGTTYAQTTGQKPFEPQVGQAGKDVVWVPTPQAVVDKMLDMARVTSQDYVIDLGSGDGITVLSAAKRGAMALGIEYNPDLVELSKRKAEAEGLTGRASFVKADIFESDFSRATVVTMFLLPDLNLRLRPILLDLKPGTRIVSNTWDMEDWESDDKVTSGDECQSWCTALLWIVPAQVQGAWQMPQGELRLGQYFQKIAGTLGSTPISEGRLRGNVITFRFGGAQYTGVVDGNEMHGTVTGGSGGTWSATRR